MAKENSNSFVAAIVLGSSKVTGIVGRKEPEGIINVLAYVAIPSVDFINKGCVFNVEKMTTNLKTIRERLEEQVNRSIGRFYVAIDCKATRSIIHSINKEYHERLTITQELLDNLLVLNREEKAADRLYLESIPFEYKLGTIVTTEPLGVMTESIHTQFLNISCNATTVETIETCFRKAGLPIERTTLAATQLATVVTSEQERTSGCVFVDMGSETTTVAVYKGKLLRHLAVIPLGGANITRDIANILNCEESEAETLKRTYGYPDIQHPDDDSDQIIPLRDGNRTYKQGDLYDIIGARVEEIVQNIKHQIDLSGFTRENLVNGLFLIGGAAQLPNIGRAFDAHFKDWNIRFSKTPTRLSVSCENRNFNDGGTFNVALAMVVNGEANCNAGERTVQKDLFESHPTSVPADPAPESTPTPAPEPESESQEPTPTVKEKSKTSIFSKFFSKTKKTLSGLVTEED